MSRKSLADELTDYQLHKQELKRRTNELGIKHVDMEIDQTDSIIDSAIIQARAALSRLYGVATDSHAQGKEAVKLEAKSE